MEEIRERDYDRERRRMGDKCKIKDNDYYQAVYDNRVGRGLSDEDSETLAKASIT